jgi:hypothetical protein
VNLSNQSGRAAKESHERQSPDSIEDTVQEPECYRDPPLKGIDRNQGKGVKQRLPLSCETGIQEDVDDDYSADSDD